MSTTSRRGAARLYLIGAIVTFAIAGFQLWSYYSGIAESVSLFADTFHAGSDGVTLLCTVLLLAFRARTNFRLEEGVHRSFTYFNIALLGAGVLLASWQLYVHRGDTVSPSWAVVVVALLGGLGDFIVWRLLLKVKHSDLPRSLWSNHSANVLHIAQDMWSLSSLCSQVSGFVSVFRISTRSLAQQSL